MKKATILMELCGIYLLVLVSYNHFEEEGARMPWVNSSEDNFVSVFNFFDTVVVDGKMQATALKIFLQCRAFNSIY